LLVEAKSCIGKKTKANPNNMIVILLFFNFISKIGAVKKQKYIDVKIIT